MEGAKGSGTTPPVGAGAFLFIASRTLSVLGDMAALTALSVHLFQSTGSATMVSGLFVARVAPRLFGPLAGALADRYDLRALLVCCDLAAFAVFLAVAVLLPSYWPLLGLVLLAESIATVSAPGARAWVARRVREPGRSRFNGVLTAGISIGFGVGAGVGGLTVTAFGHRWALLVNALTFVMSAALVGAARPARPGIAPGATAPRLLASARAGLRGLRRDRRLVAVSVGLVGVAFAAAVDRPAVVALTQHDLSGGGAGYGLVLGMISVGVLIASLSVGRVRGLGTGQAVFLAGIAAQAVGHAWLGLAPSVAVAAGTALLMGLGNGLESVVGFTRLQAAADEAQVGTVVATVMSATFVADAAGSLVGGPLVDTLGARPVFAVTAALMAGSAAVVWRLAYPAS